MKYIARSSPVILTERRFHMPFSSKSIKFLFYPRKSINKQYDLSQMSDCSPEKILSVRVKKITPNQIIMKSNDERKLINNVFISKESSHVWFGTRAGNRE